MAGIKDRAVETATYVAEKVDPFVPSVAKNAAHFAADKASSAINYTTKTVTDTVDYASKTVSATVGYANKTVTAAQNYATSKANSAVQFGKFVVKGATTTITAYTPGPILRLVTSTVDGAKHLGSDPVGTIKPYVPRFVIHAGEKTYEIVHTVQDRSIQNINATSGYIVTKVNGTVEYVTSIPQVGALIDQVEKLSDPVLKRFGVKKTDVNGEIVQEAEVVSEQEDQEEKENYSDLKGQ